MKIRIQEEGVPTLCLNMIVKNESKIIARLLESVLPIIDCYCICDTGSTDETKDIIETFFELHNIPGMVVEEPFKDFAHNRNFALQACLGMSDYVILLDADMILTNADTFDKNFLLTGDIFTILQGDEKFYYQNTRIVKNNGMYSYAGVTHEYVNSPSDAVKASIEKNQLFILDVGDGGAKSDKYERDIRLLSTALEKDPTTLADRYLFYLANSYRDSGKYEEAIETYKKRIKVGGWNQETWYCYYRIGDCYKKIDKMGDAIYYWLLGYDYLPDRLENIHEIISYYRNTSKHKLCMHFYELAIKILKKNQNRDHFLFLHNDVYTYKIYYEYTIFASWLKIFNINKELVEVFNNCGESWIINNILSNMKFYKDILKQKNMIELSSSETHFIQNKYRKLNSSSSCILPNPTGEGYIMNMRYVNYFIKENGYYSNCDDYIITINKYLELDKNFCITSEKRFFIEDEDRRYLGIEDVRFYPNDKNPELLDFVGTGYHKDDSIGVVKGSYNLGSKVLYGNEIKPSFIKSDCEKNWVNVFYKNENHFIYKWSPLQIGKVNEETNKLDLVESRDNMPRIFSHARGSTCGFTFGNQIWFILHIVSYEQPRHYYHMFAVFDLDMNLQKYSAPFKFEGVDPIEYCVGIMVEDDRVIVPYSTWDRSTKLAIYDKSYIENDVLVF